MVEHFHQQVVLKLLSRRAVVEMEMHREMEALCAEVDLLDPFQQWAAPQNHIAQMPRVIIWGGTKDLRRIRSVCKMVKIDRRLD